MRDDDLLAELADALREPDTTGPSEERVAALRAEVVDRHGPTTPATAPHGCGPDDERRLTTLASRRRPSGPVTRWLPGLGMAAALVLGLALGTVLRAPADPVVAGAVEYDGPLLAADGSTVGELEVVEAGIGRVVRLRSDALPILPTGELYEVWFVAEGDAPDAPRRISAGTFHPFADGSSTVRFAAAVDPALYPVLEITAEPGDGDPAPAGTVVARTPLG